jgi:transposase-like protein
VIPVAARWCVRYDAPYRDVKKLLAEGGITVDHATTLLCLSSGDLGG